MDVKSTFFMEIFKKKPICSSHLDLFKMDLHPWSANIRNLIWTLSGHHMLV
jgi:hypothetical protein